MCVDRAGIVGQDGETHQGIFDLSFFSIIPNITIMAPKDFEELEQMLEYAINLKAPVVIRYPRGGESKEVKFEKHEEIKQGKAEILKEGKDITIIAIGRMVEKAVKVANILKQQEKSVEIINARFLKPLDKNTIINSINKTKNVITIEDNILTGGLASHIENLIVENELQEVKLQSYGWKGEFIKHGKVEELEKLYGLGEETIAKNFRGRA